MNYFKRISDTVLTGLVLSLLVVVVLSVGYCRPFAMGRHASTPGAGAAEPRDGTPPVRPRPKQGPVNWLVQDPHSMPLQLRIPLRGSAHHRSGALPARSSNHRKTDI